MTTTPTQQRGCARTGATGLTLPVRLLSVLAGRGAFRAFMVVLAAAALAGCAQPAIMADGPELDVAASASAPEPEMPPPPALKPKPIKTTSVKAPVHATSASAEEKPDIFGLASYYHHTKTASGDKFDPHAFTAAHRTLPFGTRVRVTELKTGRSVTVRINDRGPFIRGRVVDVSKSAAQELGMTGRGITRVKLEVLEEPIALSAVR
ncbi:MAG: septal ring lytic transglycosylase RlpA family protein [Xanthobacteraceae bacterium]